MLSNYIRDLLYRYESVVIPDFGRINTETISARIDENNHTFYPPSKKLSFDSESKENDALLANYIAEVDNISEEASLNFLKFEVNEWMEKLKNQDLALENIGSFSMNESGTIVFEPDAKSNFLTDSFGMTEIEKNVASRDLESQFDNIESTEKVLPKKPTKKNTKKKPAKKKWVTFLEYAAIFLLVLAIGWFFGQQIIANNKMFETAKEMQHKQDVVIKKHIGEAIFEIKSPLKSVTLKVKSNPEFDSIMPNDAILDSIKIKKSKLNPNNFQGFNIKPQIEKTLIEKPVEKKIVETSTPVTKTIETTPVKETYEKEPLNNTKSTGKFYIIAGAFRDSGNAIELVKELKTKGYNAVIVTKNSDITQVSFGLYNSQQEADAALAKIKIQEPEAWILEK